MSERDDDSIECPKKLGYGTPPREHMFRKGQSGNPLGRPRKSKSRIAASSVDRAYLVEAQRLLRVKDDDGINELTALQVAVRHQSMAAAKGDLKAQKDFAANVRLAERAERSKNEKLFEAALEYKALCEALRELNENDHLQQPRFEINPDHLITDANTHTVTFSIAARHRLNATTTELNDLRQELIREREALADLLESDAENAAIKRDVEFVDKLLQRID